MWGFKVLVCALVVVSVTSHPQSLGLGNNNNESNEDHATGGDLKTPGLYEGLSHAGKSRIKGEAGAANQVIDPIAQRKSFRAIIAGGLEGIRAHYSTIAKSWGEAGGTIVGNLGGFGELAEAFGGKKSNVAWSRCMKSFSNHGPETFDEAVVYLLGMTKVMGDIADAFFPGVGTAYVEAWYGACVIVTCNRPARFGAKFVSVTKAKWVKRDDFVDQCQPEFAEQWGLRRYDGDFNDKFQVAKFYGLDGQGSRRFFDLINKHSGGKGLDGFSGSNNLFFSSMFEFFKSSDSFCQNKYDKSGRVDFFRAGLKSWSNTIASFAAPVPFIGPAIAIGCFDFVNQFKFGGSENEGCIGDKKNYLSTFSNFFGNGDFLGMGDTDKTKGLDGPGGSDDLPGLPGKPKGVPTDSLSPQKIGNENKDDDCEDDGKIPSKWKSEIRGKPEDDSTDGSNPLKIGNGNIDDDCEDDEKVTSEWKSEIGESSDYPDSEFPYDDDDY